MNSMTGFGRADATVGDSHYTVEVKSVNHRYLEVRFRLPSPLAYLEIPMGECLRNRFSRGSFEVMLRSRLSTQQGTLSGNMHFAIDDTALSSFQSSLSRLSKRLGCRLEATTEAVLLSGRILVPIDDERDTRALWKGLGPVFEKALASAAQMRSSEGTALSKILSADLKETEVALQELKAEVAAQPNLIFEKVKSRVQKWKTAGVGIDECRLEAEIALLADKADVSEELNRAFAHVDELRATTKQKGAIGRRLDFLLQELSREVNTLGAKTVSLAASHSVVDVKHLIEKLREQVQNVE